MYRYKSYVHSTSFRFALVYTHDFRIEICILHRFHMPLMRCTCVVCWSIACIAATIFLHSTWYLYYVYYCLNVGLFYRVLSADLKRCWFFVYFSFVLDFFLYFRIYLAFVSQWAKRTPNKMQFGPKQITK